MSQSNDFPLILQTIAAEFAAVGVRAGLVGGVPRDEVGQVAHRGNWHASNKDWDVELIASGGDPEELVRQVLERHGKPVRDTVNGTFPVWRIKVGEFDFDFSLPRLEVSTGPGHTDFAVEILTGEFSTELVALAASRRDFTIGAFWWDIVTGEIIDPVGGTKDVQMRRLRHVGPAIKDDPLRVARGVRFAAQKGLWVDNETVGIMKEMVPDMAHLSNERITAELKKTVMADHTQHGFIAMLQCGWTPQGLTPSNLASFVTKPLTGSLCARLAVVLTDGNPREFFKATTFGKAMAKNVQAVLDGVRLLQKTTSAREFVMRLNKIKTSLTMEEFLTDVFDVADQLGQPVGKHFRQKAGRRVMLQNNGGNMITGQTLIDLGVEPGERFGRLLNEAQEVECVKGFLAGLDWLKAQI